MTKKKCGKEEYVAMKIALSGADIKLLKKQAKKRGLSISRYIGSLILEYSKNDLTGRPGGLPMKP